MSETPIEEWPAGQFGELVGATFKVQVEPESEVNLELIAATMPGPHGQTTGGVRFECFSLLFTGPAERPLAQRTYRFSHERLGSFDLFIVPVGGDGNARQYEAVFNRRVPPGTPANSA
jgi:hypothetical protein